jgi:hypothetical protein
VKKWKATDVISSNSSSSGISSIKDSKRFKCLWRGQNLPARRKLMKSPTKRKKRSFNERYVIVFVPIDCKSYPNVNLYFFHDKTHD